jgi:hypothetical protein
MFEPEGWSEFFKNIPEFSSEEVNDFVSSGMSPLGLVTLNDSEMIT